MIILHRGLVLSIVGALAVAGCSGSSKTGDGGTSTGSGGPKMCTPSGTSCTAAETSAYSTCVQNACDGLYTQCLGPNYKSGSFSGVCGAYITCVNACVCGDTACTIACAPSAECLTCFAGRATCSASCTVPACYSSSAGTGGVTGTGTGTGGTSGGGGLSGTGTGGRSGGGGLSGTGSGGTSGGGGATATSASCTELLACCNASTIAQIKDPCVTLAMANDETSCALTLMSKATICPGH